MLFDYSKYPTDLGYRYRPTVPITFCYKKERFPCEAALVDTGADNIILPLEIAEVLGLEPDLDNPVETNAAGGLKFNLYKSKYQVEIIFHPKGYSPQKWKTFVYFAENQATILLGHTGFLEKFNAEFRGKTKVLELEFC